MAISLADRLVLSCEHSSNRIPRRYQAFFQSRRSMATLRGHRGRDLGAQEVARALARHFGVSLSSGTVSRLLVDLNRSLGHPRLFSEFVGALDAKERLELIAQYHEPHRRRVQEQLDAALRAGQRVLHLSVHSFTPRLGHDVRRADVGLLYDPARPAERGFCIAWKAALQKEAPGLLVRLNYPYRGNTDGLTTLLRRWYRDAPYLGIELEFNQKLLISNGANGRFIKRVIRRSLGRLLPS